MELEENQTCPICNYDTLQFDRSSCECSPVTQFSTLDACPRCEEDDYELYCDTCDLYECEIQELDNKKMKKEFKKGDKVFWVDVISKRKEYFTVKRVANNCVFFTNGGLLPIDRVFHAEKSEDTSVKNPFKNIKTPIYTLETISEACLDYMVEHGVVKSDIKYLRQNLNKGIIYRPLYKMVNYNPTKRTDDGRIELTKEEFYKAIGFVENEADLKSRSINEGDTITIGDTDCSVHASDMKYTQHYGRVNRQVRTSATPLFGNDLINKYRK